MLAMFSPSFGRPQPDWPPHTTVCGFPFYDEEFAEHTSELDGFLNEGEPPIAFTLGSSAVQAAGRFFEEAITAAGLTERRAVLVAGPNADRLRETSRDVLVVRSVPFHRLFPRCAEVVHAGGVGTTAQALRAGVSQVVVPFSHDQFDNGNRVEWMRCGLRLRKRRTASTIASALVENLRARATGTATAAGSIRAEDGVGTAADTVEMVLKGKHVN
jgi:UDP:flavonoid glycosyltransferase YjiC (YdhE family)